MAYDRNERMNAERKEENNGVVDDRAEKRDADNTDTEFAADTWMGAVFNPEASRPRGNLKYDPHTYTERYEGDRGLANETDLPYRQETEDAGEGVDRRPVRSILGDDVETAAEIAEPTRREPRSPVTEANEDNASGGIGMVGLGLSILSLFLLPYLVAPIGMVMGYLAYRRNARTLGAWAMIVGAVAILGALVIYPYYVAR
ncbi:DUF456 domain-containing protein [Brevibacillus sp. H7]|uniref:DUF456 domain-containing protein n=1 Tax=Brevibacillus sp. H7 TaxID=3349138 RepID=UPI0037F839E2